MEVVDSYMTEQYSTNMPSHTDVDMSGEYYDEEYTMDDAIEATNDEEIYDAEIDEQTGHAEVEMDEYTDEIADDETHMGTYVPTDDATVTDVTVEDVQLRSSPVASATPRGVPLPISPHAALDADLPIIEAPVDAQAAHSPHSVATLVDDSELAPPQVDGAKDEFLNEVIDLTENDDPPQTLSVEPEQEILQNTLDLTEQELYESDNLPAVTESSTGHPVAPDQSAGEKDDDGLPNNPDVYEDVATISNHPEPPEQGNPGSHSPIEEALVINQQVRDDAADSMEPSPPIRLSYRDDIKGIDKIFDVFAPSNPGSQDAELLFDDNRTLFYEPLSSFFMKLRETDHFSSDDWDDAEMGLKVDFGNFGLSISEDHRQTESISLFKLSSIWSGLGLGEPLQLSLHRYPERFSILFARLVEQVEQRDLHNEGEELHEVRHEELETGVDDQADSSEVVGKGAPGHKDEENEGVDEGAEAPTEPHSIDFSRGAEETDRPHYAHEEEGAQASEAEQPETTDEQRQETPTDDDAETTPDAELSKATEHTVESGDSTLVQNSEPASPSHFPLDAQNGTQDTAANTDHRDNDENTATADPLPNSPKNPTEIDYAEYDTEEANGLVPQGESPNKIPVSAWEDAGENEYDDYEEDYEDADGEQTTEDQLPTDGVVNESVRPDEAKSISSVPDTGAPDSVQSVGLKRNIEELEYEGYATPSAPSSPASEHKRVKHA